MKHHFLLFIVLLSAFPSVTISNNAIESNTFPIPTFTSLILDRYKYFLEMGTYQGMGADPSRLAVVPKSRYYTFKIALEHAERKGNPLVVELGTSRSYVHGGLPGCNNDDVGYWNPRNPANWDWGAGFFTRMAAVCLQFCDPIIHTVDIEPVHIARCKRMTADFSDCIQYHVSSSIDFLKKCDFKRGIDLLYLDTGDMTPIETTAMLQLQEVQIIVARDLLADDGLILIDDVRNMTPQKYGETSELGKSKYALPYLLSNGYELVASEYQVIVRKKKHA